MAFVTPLLASPFVGESKSTSVNKCLSRRPHHLAKTRRSALASRPIMSSADVDVPDVLQKIIERKAIEVDELKAAMREQGDDHAIAKVMAKKGTYKREKDFYDALDIPKGSITVIAEVKRKSPSKGHIGYIKDAGHLSRTYHAGGAGAISVLTDMEGFGGSMDDLRSVVKMQNVYKGDFPGPCPVLRKEFIIDEVQIAEAKEAGAAAVLLIVAALGKDRTKELLDITHAYGLDALVEVHDERELEIALDIGAEIVGVNNRDLRTFEVSLDNSFNLISKIPDGVIKVAESGITTAVDAWKIRDAGFNAILVGETLVTAAEQSTDTGNSYSVGYNQALGYLKAYTSKGSVEFGNSEAAAFFGQGEGAKESLGELAM